MERQRHERHGAVDGSRGAGRACFVSGRCRRSTLTRRSVWRWRHSTSSRGTCTNIAARPIVTTRCAAGSHRLPVRWSSWRGGGQRVRKSGSRVGDVAGASTRTLFSSCSRKISASMTAPRHEGGALLSLARRLDATEKGGPQKPPAEERAGPAGGLGGISDLDAARAAQVRNNTLARG
jgi:hypothetical protein